MKRIVFHLLTLMFLSCSISAQQGKQPCGTDIPNQQWENEFQNLVAGFKTSGENKTTTAYTIPVIFHIIHGGETVGTYPNIDSGQIYSQITVSNQDFSGTGLNVSTYPDSAFVHWAVNQSIPQNNLDSLGRIKITDLDIQFCLATKDTLGNTLQEPGIDRINYLTKGWNNPNIYDTPIAFRLYLTDTIKPQSIWDAGKYLNIWVTDRHAGVGYGGHATLPPLAGLPDILNAPGVGTDTTDGIWCYAKALGSFTIYPQGSYIGPNVVGRAVTHETGHYLGLWHTFGNGQPCSTDYCDDTPPVAAFSTGNPTYPHNSGTCSSPSNAPDGVMFMNFMDYTLGSYMYMFTIDQATRMQTAMLNSPLRNQLGTHGLCSTTSIYAIDDETTPFIFPNPTNGIVKVHLADQRIQSIKIYTLTGEFIQEYIAPEFSVYNLTDGLYFVIIQTDKETFVKKLIKQ